MAILFAGGEDIDFDLLTNAFMNTGGSGTNYRAGYARASVQMNDANTGDPNTFRATTAKWLSAQSSFWFTARIASTTPTATSQFINFLDPTGVRRLIIRVNASGSTTNTFKLQKRNAAGTVTDIGTFSTGTLPGGFLFKFDVNVNYSASGSVSLYANGVLLGTVNGDLLTDANTTLQQAEICSFYNFSFFHVSEVIAATTDTRSMSLVTLTSSTAGNTQAWTGTASNVNKTSINDTTYIYTTTNDLLQQYKPISSLPSGAATVAAVIYSARAIIGGSGPQKMAFSTRIATTDYASSDYTPLSGGFSNIYHYQETNPATSSAWTIADLADTNFQYGLKSRP